MDTFDAWDFMVNNNDDNELEQELSSLYEHIRNQIATSSGVHI